MAMKRLRRARAAAASAALGLGLAFAAAPAAAAEDGGELHTFHCLHGCPRGTPEFDDIIVRQNYTLASNDLTKFADWVAYRVTPESIGPSGQRVWKADPWLDPSETIEEADYAGAPEALTIDRGHQAPLAAFSGTASKAEMNILSNITPQGKALNEGAWQRLESRETALVRKEKMPLYVITGPLYERMLPPLPKADERHRIPSAYWKVIATEDGRMAAFIMDTAAPKTFNYCGARVNLNDVELRARLILFPRLAVRNFRDLSRDLGCAGS